ncbi:MAG: SDR family NAD(P)-dependent oxidoreductase [Bacteroidota bacterium]|nr:SDR family NAD(P)-dependent oxidoreductase [Bacteroidota bacterium]
MNYYFITGTSRGIGKSLAELYLKNENNRVFGYSRSQSIQHKHYTHHKTDLSRLEQLEVFSFPNLKEANKIILINNSGVINKIARFGKQNTEGIISDYTVNITAPAVLMNAFIRKYQTLEIPRIILNISSGAARRAIDAWGTYCSSKSGLDMITEVIAEEQKFQEQKHRIKVYSVAPGVIDTKMQDQIRATDENEFSNVQRFLDLKKNNELSTPDETAALLDKVIQNPENFSDVLTDVRNF